MRRKVGNAIESLLLRTTQDVVAMQRREAFWDRGVGEGWLHKDGAKNTKVNPRD
jgi:phage portal protein BeeE